MGNRYYSLTILFLLTSVVLANTFGSIDREAWDQEKHKAYPLHLVGVFQPTIGPACTAFLVSKQHAITAAHCVMDPLTGELEKGSYRFKLCDNPETYQVERFYYKELKRLTREVKTLANHWVIVGLDRPVESWQESNSFILQNITDTRLVDDKPSNPLSIAGVARLFSQEDNPLTVAINQCHLYHLYHNPDESSFNPHVASHNCDSADGDSGAPLFHCQNNPDGHFNKCILIGMQVGAYTFNNHPYQHVDSEYSWLKPNFAVTTNAFLNAVLYLKGKAPKPNALIVENNY